MRAPRSLQVCYFLYKNFFFGLPQFVFAMVWNAYSAQVPCSPLSKIRRPSRGLRERRVLGDETPCKRTESTIAL
jgi:hypothetical protein